MEVWLKTKKWILFMVPDEVRDPDKDFDLLVPAAPNIGTTFEAPLFAVPSCPVNAIIRYSFGPKFQIFCTRLVP